MVGGFGKEILSVVWAAVAFEHGTPSHLCRVLGKSIDSSSHPLLEFGPEISSVSQCCQCVVPFCSRDVQPKVTVLPPSSTGRLL